MMRALFTALVLVSMVGFLPACSTQQEDTTGNNEVTSAIEDVEAEEGYEDDEAESSDASADTESEESGEQSTADAGTSSEEFDDEEISDESFAEDDTAGEEFEDFEEEEMTAEAQAVPEQDEALEPLEEPVAEEDVMTPEPVAPISEPGSSEPVVVTAINFRSNQNGGTVVVDTSGPATFQTRANESTNQFIVEISNAQLPDNLKRPFIMKDFNGAFAAINAYQNAGSNTVRIVIQQKRAGQPVVQQEGNSLVVIPADSGMAVAQQPATGSGFSSGAGGGSSGNAAVDAAKSQGWSESYDVAQASQDEHVLGARSLDEFLTESNKFYGRPISIQTKEADIRDVINLIAEESGVNLVLSEDVKGTVSLKLRNVPWDQALVIIMRAKKLGYVRQGNVLRISSLQLLQEEAASARKIMDAQRELVPLKVKVIPVSFGKVEDLIKQIDPFLTQNRGKVVADTRTSSLIITDTDEKIGRISRLVKELDIPPAQVIIEGKIIEASEEFRRDIGINWAATGSPVNIGTSSDGAPIDLNANISVNPLPANVLTAGSFNFSVGTLDFLGSLEARLGLAQNDNLVKIISSPRIVAMNKEKAEITQGSEIVTLTNIVNGETITQAVNRVPVILNLTVTPQITASGSVIMDLDVTRQFAGPALPGDANARPVNTRSAKTKVLVDNGQTAVIGGIYQNDDSTTERGLPLLKDIPVLGWLFKSNTREKRKNELLIFLTPRVLNIQDQGVDEGTTAAGTMSENG